VREFSARGVFTLTSRKDYPMYLGALVVSPVCIMHWCKDENIHMNTCSMRNRKRQHRRELNQITAMQERAYWCVEYSFSIDSWYASFNWVWSRIGITMVVWGLQGKNRKFMKNFSEIHSAFNVFAKHRMSCNNNGTFSWKPGLILCRKNKRRRDGGSSGGTLNTTTPTKTRWMLWVDRYICFCSSQSIINNDCFVFRLFGGSLNG